MLRIVLDTNIRISSAVFGGFPRAVDFACVPPFATVLISAYMLGELQKNLSRFWAASAVDQEVQNVLKRSTEILPQAQIKACRDPDDNRILECAVTAGANYIVTGDKDLLTLHPFEGISIFSVRQFHATFLSTAAASNPLK